MLRVAQNLNMNGLAWHQRINRSGKRVDILFAVTRYGRLWQIEVPVVQPAGVTVRVLATRGFAAPYIISTARGPGFVRGVCGGTYALLIAHDDENHAQWWYVDTVHGPTPASVHEGPRVPDSYWGEKSFT